MCTDWLGSTNEGPRIQVSRMRMNCLRDFTWATIWVDAGKMSHSGQQSEKKVGEMSALSFNLKELPRPESKCILKTEVVRHGVRKGDTFEFMESYKFLMYLERKNLHYFYIRNWYESLFFIERGLWKQLHGKLEWKGEREGCRWGL